MKIFIYIIHFISTKQKFKYSTFFSKAIQGMNVGKRETVWIYNICENKESVSSDNI